MPSVSQPYLELVQQSVNQKYSNRLFASKIDTHNMPSDLKLDQHVHGAPSQTQDEFTLTINVGVDHPLQARKSFSGPQCTINKNSPPYHSRRATSSRHTSNSPILQLHISTDIPSNKNPPTPSSIECQTCPIVRARQAVAELSALRLRADCARLGIERDRLQQRLNDCEKMLSIERRKSQGIPDRKSVDAADFFELLSGDVKTESTLA